MHVNYPTEWPTECFARLRQLYADGNLFCPDYLAEVHAHWWNLYGFFAGQILPYEHVHDEPLRPIGCTPPDECLAAMEALLAEAEGIKAAAAASQGVLGEALKQLLAETVRVGLPVVLDLMRQYLDSLNL